MYTKETPLLMIPGPVESSPEVLSQMSKRAFAHTEPKFINSFMDALNNLVKVFQADSRYSPVIIGGAGTLAMEISMVNIIDRSQKEKVLICDTGYFGQRFAQLATTFGIEYDIVTAEVGHKMRDDQIASYLENGRYTAAFIQHVDTSTGVCNDIENFASRCKKNDTLSIVDGVCSAGGIPANQKSNGIDIFFTGAQKALAVPPGLAVMVFSEKAKEKSLQRKVKIPSFYSDLSNWWPVFDAYQNGGVKYFSTPSTNLIVALSVSLQRILKEGLNTRFNRHLDLSKHFRTRMIELGFDFVTASDSFANTLSTPKFRVTDDRSLLSKLKEKGIMVAGGIQAGLADKYFRVGHMGEITREQVDFVLDAISSI